MKKKLVGLLLVALLLFGGGFYVTAGDITSTGQSWADVYKLLKNLVTNVQNQSHSYGNISYNSTTPSGIDINNAIDYSIAGIMYQKAATDYTAPTAATVQAVSTECLYLFSLNSSGTLTVTKGTATATTGGAILPDLPASSAPIGYVKINTSAAGTFTMGTTTFGGVGVTATFYNLGTMPSGNSKLGLSF